MQPEKEGAKIMSKTHCISFIATALAACVSILIATPAAALNSYANRGYSGYNKNISLQSGPAKFQVSETFLTKNEAMDSKIASMIIQDNRITTPSQYQVWLCENIRYSTDAYGDEWSRPESMLERKSGDCEDFAFLTSAVLNRLGFDAKVIAYKMEDKDEWHAICAFLDGGRYYYFDNDRLKRTIASNIQELSWYLNMDNDLILLSEDGLADVFKGTINLNDIQPGNKIAKSDGRTFIVYTN